MPSSSALALALSSPAEHPHCLLRGLVAGGGGAAGRRLTRLLVNVTVDRSLWPVHVVLGADAAVEAYEREGRRPPLPHDQGDATEALELHFSKYSLESLRPQEKVMDLGSRNFFLCPRRCAMQLQPSSRPGLGLRPRHPGSAFAENGGYLCSLATCPSFDSEATNGAPSLRRNS